MLETEVQTKFDLSFLMPGIRYNNWINVYNALKKSTNKLTTEIIFVGPGPLPEELKNKPDVKFIFDLGNPNRATQIALLHAIGERVLLGSDDGVFLEGGLDHLYETLDKLGPREKNHIAVGKYIEGCGKDMDEDWYYYLNNHAMSADGIQNNWLMGCYLLINREYLIEEFGGWNYIFEASAMANHELAIRIQKLSDAKLILSEKQIVKCDHMPGISGDHGPMHYAQVDHDEPLYKKIIPNLENKLVDKYGWIKTSDVWERRFRYNGRINKFFVDSCPCCQQPNWICKYD